jgi:hypothetical protein
MSLMVRFCLSIISTAQHEDYMYLVMEGLQ